MNTNLNITTPKDNAYGASHGINAPYTLCLTNIRTTPQLKEESNRMKAMLSRNELKKKKFQMKMFQSEWCNNSVSGIYNFSDGKVSASKIKNFPCKSWTCPKCSIHNSIRVRKLIGDVAILNSLDHFLTLTLDPALIPHDYKDNSHAYITFLWNKYITYIRRKFKKITIKYIWVVEYTKKGYAHLHILLNNYLPISVLRSIWVSIGGGQQMRIEKAKNPIALARYVAKYLTKELNNKYSNFYFFQKRYSISSNCIRKKEVIITSIHDWSTLVYSSYFSIKKDLSTYSPDPNSSFVFDFYDT